jgi:hypothetical protein
VTNETETKQDVVEQISQFLSEPKPDEVPVLPWGTFVIDLPWPPPGINDFQAPIPAPAHFLNAHGYAEESIVVAAPRDGLVGDAPLRVVQMRLVFMVCLQAPPESCWFRAVTHRSHLAVPESLPKEQRPRMLGVASNPKTGDIVTIWRLTPEFMAWEVEDQKNRPVLEGQAEVVKP